MWISVATRQLAASAGPPSLYRVAPTPHPQITIIAPERPLDFLGEDAQWEIAGRTLRFVEVREAGQQGWQGGCCMQWRLGRRLALKDTQQAGKSTANSQQAGKALAATFDADPPLHTPTLHACCCTAHLQGDVLDRAAYEKAAVAKAHAVILGSLQCPDAKAADARMLTRWAGC